MAKESFRERYPRNGNGDWLRKRTQGNFFLGKNIPVAQEASIQGRSIANVLVRINARQLPLLPTDSLEEAVEQMPEDTMRVHTRSVVAQSGGHILGMQPDFPISPSHIQHDTDGEHFYASLLVKNESQNTLFFADGDEIGQLYIENDPITGDDLKQLIKSKAFFLSGKQGIHWGLTKTGLWLAINNDKSHTYVPEKEEEPFRPAIYHKEDTRKSSFPLQHIDVFQNGLPDFYIPETAASIGVTEGYVLLIQGEMPHNDYHISSVVCQPTPEPWPIRLEVVINPERRHVRNKIIPSELFATVHKTKLM